MWLLFIQAVFAPFLLILCSDTSTSISQEQTRKLYKKLEIVLEKLRDSDSSASDNTSASDDSSRPTLPELEIEGDKKKKEMEIIAEEGEMDKSEVSDESEDGMITKVIKNKSEKKSKDQDQDLLSPHFVKKELKYRNFSPRKKKEKRFKKRKHRMSPRKKPKRKNRHSRSKKPPTEYSEDTMEYISEDLFKILLEEMNNPNSDK